MLAIVVVKLLRASLPIPLSFFLLAISPNSASAQEGFVDVTESAGVSYTHGFASPVNGSDPRVRSGGVAVGDYDADGLLSTRTQFPTLNDGPHVVTSAPYACMSCHVNTDSSENAWGFDTIVPGVGPCQ